MCVFNEDDCDVMSYLETIKTVFRVSEEARDRHSGGVFLATGRLHLANTSKISACFVFHYVMFPVDCTGNLQPTASRIT